jgi:hypothetical protein
MLIHAFRYVLCCKEKPLLTLTMFIFWVVTPYGLIDTYRRFGGTYCLHFQGWYLPTSPHDVSGRSPKFHFHRRKNLKCHACEFFPVHLQVCWPWNRSWLDALSCFSLTYSSLFRWSCSSIGSSSRTWIQMSDPDLIPIQCPAACLNKAEVNFTVEKIKTRIRL